MPALFGSTLGSFISLGTVTAMSNLVHRVVTLQVTIERDGASTVQLSARGAAGVGVGSLKMLEADTPLPRELVSIAFSRRVENSTQRCGRRPPRNVDRRRTDVT